MLLTVFLFVVSSACLQATHKNILNRTRMTFAATAHAPATSPATAVGHHSPLPDAVPPDVVCAVTALLPAPGLRRVVRATDIPCATTDSYEDALGYIYQIDTSGRRVVAINRPEDTDYKARQARSAARLAVADLRDRAIAVVTAARPSFGQSRAAYHPLEGNRQRDLYIFCWEDCSAPLSETEDPPYVEVALYADGTLVRYADTLLIPS